MSKNGKIIQVIGAVVDVQFEGELPAAVREMPALAVCVIENAFAIDDDN